MKMEVINVDLGVTVESLINSDLEQLTGKNAADIQEIVEATRQKIDRSHTKRVQKQLAGNQVRLSKTEALGRSFELLKEGGEAFFTLAEIAAPASPIFAANSTFITQFNKFLREEHNGEYVLNKHQRGGKTAYKLRPFNLA